MNEQSQLQTNLTQSIKKSEEETEEFAMPSVDKRYDAYFDKVADLRGEDIIVKSNCKFCLHPLRADAEAKWEQSKGNGHVGNYSMVMRYLNDRSEDVKFSMRNITNHIQEHYEQSVKRGMMRHYAKRLADVMNYKLHKDEMFESLIQASYLKYLEIAADPHIEAPKQVDMMGKLSKSVTDISMVQAKLRGELDTIELYKDKFRTIMIKMISNEEDMEKKRKYIEQLEEVREDVMD